MLRAKNDASACSQFRQKLSRNEHWQDCNGIVHGHFSLTTLSISIGGVKEGAGWCNCFDDGPIHKALFCCLSWHDGSSLMKDLFS